jgi:cell division protein FtsW (lipid II flippase)
VNWLGNESDKAGWRALSAKAFFIRRKGVMRIIAAVVLFLVLFRWDRPTPMVVFWLAVLLLLLLVVIEFFGREPLAEDGSAKQGDRVGQPA